MNEQRIIELLDLADSAATPVDQAGPNLAGRAIRRARRRSALKHTGLAVNAVAAVVVLAFVFLPGQPASQPGSAPVAVAPADNQDTERQLADLRARIAAQEAIIEALLERENLVQAPVIQAVNPLDEVYEQADLAAKQMVLAADRMERSRGRNDLSDQLYRDVVTHFSESDWAAVARNRLTEHEPITQPRSAL